MKIKLLQKKRNQLAGYCKLVIYGVLDLVAATDVLKHYSKVEMIMCHKRRQTFWPISSDHFVLAVQEMCAWKLNIKADV